MIKKISLVVGNGLSISFNNYHQPIKYQDTQQPLSWDIPNPSGVGLLIESLPYLNHFRNIHDGLSDFELFKLTIDEGECAKADLEPFPLSAECRHYLAMAFSHYTLLQKKMLSFKWEWYRWFDKHKVNIHTAMSYNYDLLIEHIFLRLNIRYVDTTLPRRYGKVILHKPHGSCSYDIHPKIIAGYTPKYPINVYLNNTNAPFIHVPNNKLLQPRRMPYCIVPNEVGFYENFQQIKPIHDEFHHSLSSATHCVFIGVSYMDCDQEEINQVINKLNQSCKVIVANPYPSSKFIEKLQEKGLNYVIWRSTLGPVDDDGELLLI